MASAYRINQSKLRYLSYQFKRHYVQVPYASSLNQATKHPRPSLLENTSWDISKRPTGFCDNVRFFAAPVQPKLKKEEVETDGPRLNNQIKAQFVRVVTDEGHSIVSIREALERARKLELDLVEVQRGSDPPVCKIMDFHKEKYKQQVKEKDRAKSKSEVTLRKGDCKEVRFTVKIEQKDLKMKADTAIRLMEQGYRVKCMAMGKGKEGEDEDLGGLLSRLTALIEDVAIVESGPRVERKQAYVIIRHIKFGLPKKGGKKLKDAGDISAQVQKLTATQLAGDPSADVQGPDLSDEDPAESGLEPPPLPGKVPSFHPERSIGTENRYKRSEQRDQFPPTRSMDNKGPGMRESVRSVPAAESGLESPPLPGKIPSFHPERSTVTENRYKRSEQRIILPPTRSMDNKGPGLGESVRPRFPQQRQPPSHANVSASTGSGGTDPSTFRNLKLPPNQMPRQQPSRPDVRNNSASSYGIFSTQNANGPEKQGASADIPGSKSDGSQRMGVDHGGQGRYGPFNRESSNVIPNRTTKPN